ncbi:cell division protein FtsA [Pacificimonas flava]|uniref:Cell division protein FtsA n=2 Tax=Pacificimonas TaxID=1960290 RepID=A0A219B7X1_9SPHN|nr:MULTISPECIES: cell division protein FtsA [Pacificimonas]MBZ6378900.1 cell division protein FtsA [Pacificimonas aurantium]OWV33848.1 cell division protein FtsA [Pacificimonas flava]
MFQRKGKTKHKGEQTLAALDVGTSKVAAVIAILDEDREEPRVIGSHQMSCSGLKNGIVVDLAATEAAIRMVMDRAERAAGSVVQDVVVGISAGGLESDVVPVEIEIGGQRIEPADIDMVHHQARAGIDPGERTILHAEPALYTIDGQGAVMNPLGLHARTLGAAIHVVSADTAPLRNLDRAVRSADLDVTAIVSAPVASAKAALSREEREVGIALVEIGAGVTNIAVFAQNLLAGFSSIPMGGADITEDVANALGTPRLAAERLKALKGSASSLPRDNHELIDVPCISGGEEQRRRPRAELVHAIRSRLDILFDLIADRFEEIGFVGPRANQVVLTGGGAALSGIADYAESMLGRQVRIGMPRGLADLPDAQRGSAFTALAGLLLVAAEGPESDWSAAQSLAMPGTGGSALSRMIQLLKSSF